MVNRNKHTKVTDKFGMLPIENQELMHKLNAKIIDETNENPQMVMETLDALNDELNGYYNLFNGRNNGSVLKTGVCQRILEVYEHVFVIKNTIQFNYHMLRIDGELIKAILFKCDRVLNEFMNIQAKQNKNIDNKIYGGFFSVKYSNRINNTNVPKEMLENVIRLATPISLANGGDSDDEN